MSHSEISDSEIVRIVNSRHLDVLSMSKVPKFSRMIRINSLDVCGHSLLFYKCEKAKQYEQSCIMSSPNITKCDMPGVIFLIVITRDISKLIPPKNLSLVKVYIERELFCLVFMNNENKFVDFVMDLNLVDSLSRYKKFFSNPQNALITLKFSNIIATQKNCDVYNMVNYISRDAHVKFFGWTCPTRDTIMNMCKFIDNDRVLEIFSGFGFWAFLLKAYGINIIPTSLFHEHKQVPIKDSLWINVKEMSYDVALDTYQDADCLLIVWGRKEVIDTQLLLEKFKGNKIIVVGEDEDGCTFCLDDKFVSSSPSKNTGQPFDFVGSCDLQQFAGLYDNVSFYKRH